MWNALVINFCTYCLNDEWNLSYFCKGQIEPSINFKPWIYVNELSNNQPRSYLLGFATTFCLKSFVV